MTPDLHKSRIRANIDDMLAQRSIRIDAQPDAYHAAMVAKQRRVKMLPEPAANAMSVTGRRVAAALQQQPCAGAKISTNDAWQAERGAAAQQCGKVVKHYEGARKYKRRAQKENGADARRNAAVARATPAGSA
jgi:hypothetical protein